MIQVTKGYKLELMLSPYQKSPPRPLETKSHHYIEDEIQKLVAKGAVKKVSPCAEQFLSQIFKKDGSARLVINLRSIHIPTTFQDGELGDDERLAKERRLDGINRPKGCLPVSLKEGLEHQTIKTIWSWQIEGIPMGQHPIVSKLLRGVYNTRPPQPRYTTTWDVDVVIKYFSAFEWEHYSNLENVVLEISPTDGGKKSIRIVSSRPTISFMQTRRCLFPITNLS